MNRQERRAEGSRRKKEKRVILERTDGGPPLDVTVDQAFGLAAEIQAKGRLEEAEHIYRRLLAADPGHRDGLTNLGAIAAMSGRFELAIALLEQALQQASPAAPPVTETWLNYGVALRGVGRVGDALQAYGKCLELDPSMAAAHHNLAGLLLGMGELSFSLQSFRKAAHLQPADPALWRGLGNCIAAQTMLPDDPALADEIAVCLSTQGVAAQPLIRRACFYLKRQPVIAALLAGLAGGKLVIDGGVVQALDTRLTAACLIYEVIRDGDLERLFTQVRARLLLDSVLRNQAGASLVFALSMQCFLNEYVYDETHEEAAAVASLITKLSASDLLELAGAPAGPLGREIAILGAYRPLNTVPFADALSRFVSDSPMAALLERQINAPRTEEKLRATITKLTPLSDETSIRVQSQYEENPYPRWCNTGNGSPLSVGQTLISRFPHLQGREMRYPETPRVLIAGCGTGLDAIGIATSIHGAQLTAIDLSLASLAYARRMADEFGVNNIEFFQADIMHLRDTGMKFDFIQAFGVLHHMRDPLQGWRILTDCLRPSGLMRIALYSEIARAPVIAARGFIAENSYPPTLAGIRDCRRAIMALPEAHLVKPVMCEGSDFYTTSGCRDLLFHTQEHRFTCLQRKQMIETLGLEFLGFEFLFGQPKARYAERFPDDPDMINLANWHEFELLYPDTFAGTDPMWLRKPDAA